MGWLCWPGGDRTRDLLIMSELLCRLSYRPLSVARRPLIDEEPNNRCIFSEGLTFSPLYSASEFFAFISTPVQATLSRPSSMRPPIFTVGLIYAGFQSYQANFRLRLYRSCSGFPEHIDNPLLLVYGRAVHSVQKQPQLIGIGSDNREAFDREGNRLSDLHLLNFVLCGLFFHIISIFAVD